MTKCTEKEENKGTTTYSYKYDSAGNRTAYEKVSKGETVEKYSYKYNDSNQLISKTEKTDWRPWKHVKTTYEYDEDGNLLSESSGKKDTKTYEYTVENHLKAVTTSNEVLMAALYDGDGNRLFTLDYVEDGKDSQKGQVLIPESAKTENGDSPAEQLADLVPKKNQEEYYSITQYVNDINRENTEVLMELKTDGRTGPERSDNPGTEQAAKRIADLEREIEQRKQSREYRSIADKIKANRGTIDQRDRQQEKSRRRSRGMEI